MKPTIKITDDVDELTRIGGREWAVEHAGKFYKADIKEDGWAYIDNAKFPSEAFETVIG